MAIVGIGQSAPVSADVPTQSLADLDEFLKLFLTQLNYQDPLEPMDNSAFLAQMAQFSQVELQNRTAENTLQTLQALTVGQVVGLLGTTIEAFSGSMPLVGEVIAIEFQDGIPSLAIQQGGGNVVTGVSAGQIRIITD